MALKLSYGAYTSGDGTLVLEQSAPAIEYSARGDALTKTINYTIKGLLYGTDASDIASKAAALRSAFATDGSDLSIKWPGGATAANLILDDSATLSGVRIIQPPELDGSAGSSTLLTLFPYRLTAQAVYDMQAGNILIEYSDTYQKTNPRAAGGTAFHVPISQRAQIYNTSQKGAVLTTQTGHAVGWTDYPEPCAPRWKSHEIEDARSVTYSQPDRQYRNGDRWFRVDWSYTFVSASKLNGEPNEVPSV